MPKLEYQKPEGFLENFEAFFTAVDIKEKFNLWIVAFHVFVFFLALFTKNRKNFQLFLFFGLLGLCYFLEKINSFFRNN